jgi:4-hydroxy-tetrahydrodipicolinate reductase
MKIALIGYGKMGKAIEAIALAKGHTVGLKIDMHNEHELTAENLQQHDVAIEFTGPHSAVKNIMACLDAGVPVVSGSTGWLEKWEKVKNYCQEKHGTLLYASNFSIGVNIFFELNKKLAELMSALPEYAVSIEEIHHTAKKDAPSGTAITLAEQVLQQQPLKTGWINEATSDPTKLTIISKREDPAPGTHHVKYASPIDDIEIIHTAHSRDGFAAGAVMAANFLAGMKGIFTMQDVMNIT